MNQAEAEQALREGMDKVRELLELDGYLKRGDTTYLLTDKAAAGLPLLLTVCAMTDHDLFVKICDVAAATAKAS